MRAGRWPVASLGVPHGGVDGRAGGVRSVQVGQLRAHVQGVGVLDGDLTEDRGVGGKQYAMPGRGGGEEREDVRGPRRGGEHDVCRVRPRERCWGGRTTGRRSTVRRCCGAVCGAGCWAVWGRVAGGGGAGRWRGRRHGGGVTSVTCVSC